MHHRSVDSILKPRVNGYHKDSVENIEEEKGKYLISKIIIFANSCYIHFLLALEPETNEVPLSEKERINQMSIEDIQEKIAKIEKQKKQLTTEIYRLPIANRHKAILDRENELYTVSFIPDHDNFIIDD